MSIEWADPGPSKSPGRKRTVFTSELIDAMRANPGRWALIKKGHPSTGVVYQFKKNNRDFEAVTRGSGPFDIYARFVGESR